MIVDYSPLVQASVGLAGAALTLGTAYLTILANAHIKNIQLRAEADRVLEAGHGIAYSAMVAGTQGGKLDFPAAEAAAVSAGTQAVTALASSAVMDMLGGAGNISTLVQGGLGQALKVDPTVSAVGGSSATASAPPGQAAISVAGIEQAGVQTLEALAAEVAQSSPLVPAPVTPPIPVIAIGDEPKGT